MIGFGSYLQENELKHEGKVMPSMSRKAYSNPLHVAVVGGSIGGLTTALLMRSLGHDVDVFERATGELMGLAAGIIAHEVSVRYLVERTTTSLDTMTVPDPYLPASRWVRFTALGGTRCLPFCVVGQPLPRSDH